MAPGGTTPRRGSARSARRGPLARQLRRGVRLADTGEWDVIDTLPGLDQGPAFCTSTLHVYHPADVLPIYSRDHLLYYLEIFGRADTEHAQLARVALTRALLDAVRAHPGLSGWTPTEVAFFLYDAFHPREQRRVVKIAPGENAKFWADCRDNGYICVGWDDVGDLRAFASKAEFRARFTETYGAMYRGNKAKISAKANEVWTLRELEPGDLVVANQGTAKVLALGEVQDPAYEWRDDRGEFRHTVRVALGHLGGTVDSGAAELGDHYRREGAAGAVPVAHHAERARSRRSAIQSWWRRPGSMRPTPLDPEFAEIASGARAEGAGQFCCGPPGTGKTHTARRFARRVAPPAARARRPGCRSGGRARNSLRPNADLSTGARAPGCGGWCGRTRVSGNGTGSPPRAGFEYRHGSIEPNFPRVRVDDRVSGTRRSARRRGRDCPGEQALAHEPESRLNIALRRSPRHRRPTYRGRE